MAGMEPADRSGSMLTNLDFGTVSVGQSATRELTVHNIGTADLSVTNIPSPDPPFSVVSPPDSSPVAPGGQRSVTVQFSPTTVGVQSGVLSIASNDPDAATVLIALQGVGGGGVPNIEVTPAALDFGNVSVGQSTTRELTVRNTGTAMLSVTNLSSPTPPFSVVSPAVPFTVAPNGQRPVTVRFSPITVGVQSGVLSIASNDPDAATVAVPLQGAGLGVPNISVAPAQLDFGNVSIGQSTTRELTVHNTGTAVLSVTNLSSPTPRFSVVSPAVPFTVAPNGQRPVTVRFSPTTVGVQSGVLSIASNQPDAATIPIPLQGAGLGVPNISVAPAQLDFGNVSIGQSTTRELTVHNTGTAVLSVTNLSSPTPRFSVVSPAVPFTVAPNGQRPVTVRFSPTTVGVQSGVLSITSNDPDAATVAVPLPGVGVGVPISVWPRPNLTSATSPSGKVPPES